MALLSDQTQDTGVPPPPPGTVPEVSQAPPPPPGTVPESNYQTPKQMYGGAPASSYQTPQQMFGGTSAPPPPPPPGTVPEQSVSTTPWSPWERTQAAFSEGLHGSFMGRAADALATMLAPNTVPIDPNTGQPMNAATPREQVRSAIAEDAAQTALRPSSFNEPSLGGKITGAASEVAGTLAGGMMSPESLVGGPEAYGLVREGEAFLPTLLKSAGVQAGVQGAANAAGQGVSIAAGNQDQFDPSELAQATGMGALFGAAPAVGAKIMNLVRGERPRIGAPAPGGEPGTPTPSPPAEGVPPPPPGTVPETPVPPAPVAPTPGEVPPVPPVPEASKPGEAPTPPAPEPAAVTEPPSPPGPVTAAPASPTGDIPTITVTPKPEPEGAPAPDERAAAPAPVERPPSTPDVGAQDTGRVQPAEAPARVGGEGAAGGGEAGDTASAGRAPEPAVGTRPPEARPVVEPSEPGAARAPEGEPAPSEARPGDTAQGTEPVAQDRTATEISKELHAARLANAAPERIAELEREYQAAIDRRIAEAPKPEPKPVSPDTEPPKEPTEFLERQDTGTSAGTPEPAPEVKTSQQAAHDQAQQSSGASPFREVFRDAGHDPDAAVQLPIAHQARIIRDQVAKTFGFRKVVSGQKHIDTVNQLSNFYQNAKAMAHVLGVPYSAIGLHGRLALNLEKMTLRKGYLGMYHPMSRTIGLPGRTNSFAHEWTHALDHYLAELSSANPKARRLLSETAGLRTGAHMPDSTEEAFAKVIGTLYGKHGNDALTTLALQHRAAAGDGLAAHELVRRETDFARNAREYGDAHGGQNLAQYYYRPAEMVARAHEAYVADRIEAARQARLVAGHDAPFDTRAIAKPDDIYSAEGTRAVSEGFEKLYPKADERAHIFEAFQQLHDQMTADHLMGPPRPPAGDLPGARDMVQPANWSKMANTNSGKAGVLRQEINAWRNLGGQIRDRLGINRARAEAPHSLATRAADFGRAATYSTRALIEVLVHRAPAAAKPMLQELMDHLSPAEGVRTAALAKGRYFGDVYEQSVKTAERRALLRFTHILQNNNLENMSDAEARTMHGVMTGHVDPATVDPRIRDAASKLRFMLNEEHARNRGAGIDLGYTPEAYFPRVYDDYKIYRDPRGFERAATEAYGHVFDKNTVNGGDRNALIEHGLDLDADAHAPLRADVKRLQRMDAERGRINERLANGTSTDVQGDQAQVAKLQSDADALHASLVDPIRDAWSAQSGEHFKNGIMLGGPTEYDTRGPASSYQKGRTLTTEADRILQDWMVHDPREAIPMYFHQSARRVAFAEHFGLRDKNGKLRNAALIDDNLRNAVDKGMAPEDERMFRSYIETVTGRQKSNLPSAFQTGINHISALGSMALMTRSAFSSLGEPMAALARTGSVRTTMTALSNQIGDLFKTANSAERRQLAEALGIITSSHYDSIVTSRIGSHYADNPSLNRVTTWYFRRIGLTALTNSQRQSMLDASHVALGAWAKDLMSTKTSRLAERARHEAAAQFRDLGIGDADHQRLAQWILDKQGKRVTPGDLETQGGALWGRAASHMVDQIIQDPLRVDKPLMATNSIGKLAFGLMSFNYAFYHNIVDRTFGRYWDRFKDAEGVLGKGGEVLRAGGHLAASGAGIYGGALLSTIAREAIFNPTKWQEHSDQGDLFDWLSDLAIQRTGVNGPLDPIQQAITGLRYEKSLNSIFSGAQLGFLTNAAEKVLRAVVQTSPHTNTADYNALQGVFNGLAVPAEVLALTAIPGGPLSRPLLTAMMMGGTGPGASDWFARQFVGPKGTKAYDPEATTLPGLEADKADTLPGLDESTGGAGGGVDTSGGIPTAGLGFADDVAVPILRGMMRLPGPIKALGAAGVIALGVSALAHEFGRFSNPEQ